MAIEERQRVPLIVVVGLVCFLLGMGVANLPFLSSGRQLTDAKGDASNASAPYLPFIKVLIQLESAISLGTSLQEYDGLIKSLDSEIRSIPAELQKSIPFASARQVVKIHADALEFWRRKATLMGNEFSAPTGEMIRENYPYVPYSKFTPFAISTRNVFAKNVCLAGTECSDGNGKGLLTPKQFLQVLWECAQDESVKFKAQLAS